MSAERQKFYERTKEMLETKNIIKMKNAFDEAYQSRLDTVEEGI